MERGIFSFLKTAQKRHRDAGGHVGGGPAYQSATCVAGRRDQVQTAPIVAIRFFHVSENHQHSPKVSRVRSAPPTGGWLLIAAARSLSISCGRDTGSLAGPDVTRCGWIY